MRQCSAYDQSTCQLPGRLKRCAGYVKAEAGIQRCTHLILSHAMLRSDLMACKSAGVMFADCLIPLRHCRPQNATFAPLSCGV